MMVKGAKRILKEIEEGGDPEFENKKNLGDFTEYMLQRACEIGLEIRSMAPTKVCELIFEEMKKREECPGVERHPLR